MDSGLLCLSVSPACCLRITLGPAPVPAVHTGWLPTRRRGLHTGAISAWGGGGCLHFPDT